MSVGNATRSQELSGSVGGMPTAFKQCSVRQEVRLDDQAARRSFRERDRFTNADIYPSLSNRCKD